MILHVKDAKYLHDYVIWVRFNDGAEGEIAAPHCGKTKPEEIRLVCDIRVAPILLAFIPVKLVKYAANTGGDCAPVFKED